MLDHFVSGISCDQTYNWGIEWDTCALVNHIANFR
jgi:hypothetical protein